MCVLRKQRRPTGKDQSEVFVQTSLDMFHLAVSNSARCGADDVLMKQNDKSSEDEEDDDEANAIVAESNDCSRH